MTIQFTANQPIAFSGGIVAYSGGDQRSTPLPIVETTPVNFTNLAQFDLSSDGKTFIEH